MKPAGDELLEDLELVFLGLRLLLAQGLAPRTLVFGKLAGLAAALPHIRSGRAVPLAVTSAQRSALLPDVPTVAESGVAGVQGFEAVGWLGLMAPKGTPSEIIQRLQHEVHEALTSEAMVRFIRERGSEPSPSTGPEFDAFVAAEIRKWGQVVKLSGAKPE